MPITTFAVNGVGRKPLATLLRLSTERRNAAMPELTWRNVNEKKNILFRSNQSVISVSSLVHHASF